MLYESMYVKCPEWAKVGRQKVKQQLPRAVEQGDRDGGGWGGDCRGGRAASSGDQTVLKLDCGDDGETL